MFSNPTLSDLSRARFVPDDYIILRDKVGEPCRSLFAVVVNILYIHVMIYKSPLYIDSKFYRFGVEKYY